MFHTIYVISTLFFIPTIFTIIEYLKKNQTNSLLYIICKWFAFFAIGIRSFTASLMQIVNPSYTASLLEIGLQNKIIIQELGCAQLGIAVLGILSLFKSEYRKSASISCGIFMIGASIIHISRLSTINFEEIISLVGDIFIICIAVLCLLQNTVTLNKKDKLI